ncbi:MAG TPA: cupin domain-containing protein [Dehalococcoidales bacterium]|nr:cupin domain-containing protein [Dehalococcoidales bacterium]
MKVIKTNEVKSGPLSDLFIGELDRVSLTAENLIGVDRKPGEIVLGLNTFKPGATTKMHTHDKEQFLYITSGKGWVGTEKEVVEATPGMLVYFAANEPHFHGASRTTSMGHLAIGVGPVASKVISNKNPIP